VTSEPIKIEGMAVANQGQSYVDEMDLEIDLGSEITTEGWQVELGRVEVFGEQGRLINLQARGGRLKRDDDIMKLVGRLDADLAGLSTWPGLSGLGELNRGRLQAEFGVGVEERLSVATAISVTELETRSGQTMPAVDLDGRVDFRPDGSLELHLPIEITAGDRASDLTFNLRAESSAADWKLEGSLTGPKIHLQDIQALSAITGPAEENETLAFEVAAPVPNLSPVQANPSRAIWTGVSGSIQAAVGEIVVEGSPNLSRFEADVLIAPEALKINALSLGVGENGEVKIDGQLAFDGAAPQPYLASADVVASDVAVEPWLRWIDPDSVPILEGNVNLNANWSAQVSDLATLSSDGQITAQVSSTGGVLRALGVEVEDYVKTGQTVAALGALFGAVTGNEKLTQQAQLVQSATRVAERLSLVEFDQLNLNLERAAAGDVVISELSLISPALRLIGDGRINYREGLAFWLQPLALRMDLSARDDLGIALTRLGLLKSEADALGYLPLVTDFTLDGSLANIGTKELERLLVRAFTGR
ncbi:AsmA family protein, partial [Opitutaceae bacterium]|nr:AsmA family protein [Opitutaceae bacterium]